MKDYSGGIRHDYREKTGDNTSVPIPRWPWFLAGLCLPVAVIPWAEELASTRWSRSARPPLPPDRWNLPYAQSDRPLLI